MKPIIKWTGGKRWLVPFLNTLWERHSDKKLIEPFTGGMAITLGLNPKNALLNDVNEHLINFYQQIKKGFIITLPLKNQADCYYQLRERFNHLIKKNKQSTKEAATIFYFLIRTGYNGLCRFNSHGEFNVPFGHHRSIRYKSDFLDYKPLLNQWEFSVKDFEQLTLKGDEFLYADPPYDVEFTQYHEKAFHFEDQVRLAKWLSNHHGPVITSNQATDRIIKLYQKYRFNIFTVAAPRSISCTGDRTPALEMIAIKGFSLEDRQLFERNLNN